MTPQEAADIVERLTRGLDGPKNQQACDLLIDHARATAEPGDLAALANELEDDDVDRIEWRDRRRYARALRAHRCAPAAPEIVTGAEAAELPVGSIFVQCEPDGTPVVSTPVTVGDMDEDHHYLADMPQLVLYRAPAPAPPIAVGDTVTTAAELDRLPVGSAIRPNDGGVAERMASGSWWQTDVDGPRPVSRLIPARVLDLGEVTS